MLEINNSCRPTLSGTFSEQDSPLEEKGKLTTHRVGELLQAQRLLQAVIRRFVHRDNDLRLPHAVDDAAAATCLTSYPLPMSKSWVISFALRPTPWRWLVWQEH